MRDRVMNDAPMLTGELAPEGHLDLGLEDWIYVHKHCRASLVDDGDGYAVRIEGLGANNDTHISPGGREGGLRLGMSPGHTYTFAADVEVEEPLRGVLSSNALRIVVGWVANGQKTWNGARSDAAQNVPGRTRLSVTFTVPADAEEAWVRLFCGAAKGAVRWSGFHLSEGFEVPAQVAGAEIDPESHLAAAVDKAREGMWPEALELSEAAVQAEPGALAPRLLMSSAAEKLRQPEQIIAALAPVYESPDVDAATCYALSRAYQRLGRLDEARDANRAGLFKDPRADEVAAKELLAASPDFIPERVAIRRFVAAHLDQIRRLAKASRVGKSGDMPYVFVYWAQGMEAAPPIVRACYERLKRVPGIELRLITEATVPYWVDLPDHIKERVPATKAAFADWLRIALLKEYGGIWVDATCYVTGDLGIVDELVGDRRFFAFRYNAARISSWFLAARNNSYIVHMMHAALEVYFRSHDAVTHYFFFHDLFEALAQLDDRFGEIWETKGQHADTSVPHRLQGVLREPSGTGEDLAAIHGSFVHKLTYKLKPHEIAPDTVAGALVRGDYEGRLMSEPEEPRRRRFAVRR